MAFAVRSEEKYQEIQKVVAIAEWVWENSLKLQWKEFFTILISPSLSSRPPGSNPAPGLQSSASRVSVSTATAVAEIFQQILNSGDHFTMSQTRTEVLTADYSSLILPARNMKPFQDIWHKTCWYCSSAGPGWRIRNVSFFCFSGLYKISEQREKIYSRLFIRRKTWIIPTHLEQSAAGTNRGSG